MSRGLGRLQQEILATLDPAQERVKQAYGTYEFMSRVHDGGVAICHGQRFRVPDGVYDLRAVLRVLKRQKGISQYGNGGGVFSAAFSRAIRGLIKRGHLVSRSQSREIRFVERKR